MSLTPLAERLRDIMLGDTGPLTIKQISRTIEIPDDQVGAAMRELAEKKKAKLTAKGWMAI